MSTNDETTYTRRRQTTYNTITTTTETISTTWPPTHSSVTVKIDNQKTDTHQSFKITVRTFVTAVVEAPAIAAEILSTIEERTLLSCSKKITRTELVVSNAANRPTKALRNESTTGERTYYSRLSVKITVRNPRGDYRRRGIYERFRPY